MSESEKGGSAWQWLRLIFLIALVVFVVIGVNGMSGSKSAVVITGTELYAAINEGRVKEINIYESGSVEGIFTDGTKFETSIVSVSELEKAAIAKGVPYRVMRQSTWSQVILGILPWLLFIFIMYYFIFRPIGKQAGNGPGGVLSFSKSKIKFIDPNKIEVSLADVAGCNEVKRELEDILDFLENPGPYFDMNAKPPHGILLIGPPGCGKTMLAKGIAKEVGVPFGYLSGSDFVEMFVGVGAGRMRDTFAQVFEQAHRSGTCILFIDEIDAIGRRRGAGLNGHEEREQALNELLAQMDGFEYHSGVIVIGATNRPEVLDEALLRPGRFDRKITMPLPDLKGREEILKVHSRGVPMEDNADLGEIARATTSFSGAKLENIIKEAKIIAIRNKRKKISRDDMREALDKEIMGQERALIMQIEEKERVAYHEAGHTLCVKYDEGAESLYKVTILPRGLSLGATYQLPKHDRYVVTKEFLMAQIVVSMGGRVAEMFKFNQMSTGAASDFSHATEIATEMVCKYGMSEKIGMVVYERSDDFWGGSGKLNCSPQTQAQIDLEIKALLDIGYEKAMKILTEHKNELDALAKALMEKEKLDAEEIEEILKNCKPG